MQEPSEQEMQEISALLRKEETKEDMRVTLLHVTK